MKDLEIAIKEVVDSKAEQDNQIDLNAYEKGIRDFAKAINYSQCCKSDSEQLLAYTKFLREELHLNISDNWVESYINKSK